MKRIEDLVSLFSSTFDITKIIGAITDETKGKYEITGLKGGGKALFVLSVFRQLKSSGINFVITARNNREAVSIFNDIKFFSPNEPVYLIPSRETLPYDNARIHPELLFKRMKALNAFIEEGSAIFIVPVRSLVDFYMPVNVFKRAVIGFIKGGNYNLSEIERNLSATGYERVDRVVEQGSFAVRGDILDIFPVNEEYPFRISFFDSEVEFIKRFSPETQRSIDEVNEIKVIPAGEVITEIAGLSDYINSEYLENYLSIKNNPGVKGISPENYTGSIYKEPSILTDYAGQSAVYVFDSYSDCIKQASFYYNEAERLYMEKVKEIDGLPKPDSVVLNPDRIGNVIKNYIDILEIPTDRERNFDFNMLEKRGYRGQIKSFKDDIEDYLINGYSVYVGANYSGQVDRLKEILKDMLERYKNLHIVKMDISEGFISHEMKIFVILDREIFNRKRREKSAFLKVKSRPIEGILDIENGDYIVHVEHGIGIYRGIEKLKAGNVEKDFVKIEYRDGDEIFVPIDQINLLQKYVGYKGRTPRIDKLGTDTWKKIKEHVKKSVKNLASELLEIYSARAALRGHAFSKDTEWQYEFESGFKYEETPDQIRTIMEVKRDMESEKPMDRLICGDVGFGKTEVALRAAFKAVMDGKQVAVLVPTTILAEQHLNTFKERFALYPVTIEMLSRFRTPKEQREIIKNLKNGLIDIVIGTHRLVQKDVEFKDLGLVIIDEEQRFGVEHKEKFKKLRKLVDVITMTATPIPRTLYMSMTRIRDMSIIETPPQDRVPIETYVLEHNDDVIVQAIRREVERGGQVYYVHNRIKTIEERAEYLRRLMPDISFEVAHGRMDEDELEEVMKAFYDMEFNVLVSTTIIESGLDIPNVNTIIIERADRFGLSQLYQLRGRVGRSSRKAYAYLLYPPGRVIGEKAEKRLSVINDYTELGSGFSIAMKDLEIRGAGNILGREQHGDILAVGFEMYVKLLDEAIRKLKEGEAYQEEIEPVIDIKYRGYIPENFIESEKLRIELYKKLASVRSQGELNELIEEIIDRFGAIPEPMRNLLEVVRIRILCKEVGIKYFGEKENEIQITFEKSRVDIIKLIQKINKNRKIFSISPKSNSTLHIYRVIPDNREKYQFLKELFDYEEGNRGEE